MNTALPSNGPCAQDALAGYIKELVGAAMARQGSAVLRTHELDELAGAVSWFCSEHHGGRPLQLAYIHFLAARALCRLGLMETARHVLGECAREDFKAGALLGVLSQHDATPALCSYLALELLRPTRWDAAPKTTVWVLDCARLNFESGLAGDLLRNQAFRKLAADLAPLWQATDGEGCLGIRQGRLASHSATASWDLAGYLGEALECEGRNRGWACRPHVTNLEPVG